jgi:ParB family transcriptional regulator, chromosome partitioning protein
MNNKRRGLGKGLSALLESRDTDITSSSPSRPVLAGTISAVGINQIEVNPFQPRQEFDKEQLAELAASIEQYGIIQPLTVRKLGVDKYQLISGERRFRASQMAGLTEVPVYVRITDDQGMLEMALVENIQRQDLDAIEIAMSYQRLIDECGLTQEKMADKVGKKRTTVTNYLRLLKLPAPIQLGIRNQQISMGHARALINLESEAEQLRLYNKIVSEQLSVRDIEQLASESKNAQTSINKSVAAPLSFGHQKLKTDLSEKFGTKIDLKRDLSGKGKIIITFENEDDLARIAEILDVN